MPSEFDTKRSSSPKFTFGIARDFYEKVYYETNKMLDKNVPGPGKYNYLKSFGSEASKFSITGKQPDHHSKGQNPGPGQYPLFSINPQGKYPVSNVKNTASISFATKSERFKYTCKFIYLKLVDKNPGPERYKIKSLIDGTGYLYCSKFRSSTSKSISGRHPDMSHKFTSKIR